VSNKEKLFSNRMELAAIKEKLLSNAMQLVAILFSFPLKNVEYIKSPKFNKRFEEILSLFTLLKRLLKNLKKKMDEEPLLDDEEPSPPSDESDEEPYEPYPIERLSPDPYEPYGFEKNYSDLD